MMSYCTHEEIVGIRIWAANSEKLHQIMELAMYITANSDGALLWTYEPCSRSVIERGKFSKPYHRLNIRLIL